jgi:hypothetical protein
MLCSRIFFHDSNFGFGSSKSVKAWFSGSIFEKINPHKVHLIVLIWVDHWLNGNKIHVSKETQVMMLEEYALMKKTKLKIIWEKKNSKDI